MKMYVVASSADMARLWAEGGVCLHVTAESAKQLANAYAEVYPDSPQRVFPVELSIEVREVEEALP